VIQAVEAGLGIGSSIEEPLAQQISSGRLVQVLKDCARNFRDISSTIRVVETNLQPYPH
jgi:hypothetical protein